MAMMTRDLVQRLRAAAFVDAPEDDEDARTAFEEPPEITWEELHGIAALLREAADEIERNRAAHAWRPIETAPKDGRFILVAAHGEVHHVQWADNHYDEPHAVMRWCIANSHDRDYGTADIVEGPTHWMPLPAPPGVPTPEGADQ